MFDDIDHDMEKLRAQERDRKQRSQELITALYTELESLLEHPATPDTLKQQADVLDAIFAAMMRRNVMRDKENGYIDPKNLEFALRIQKQCNDTLKTRAAIDYMQNITKGDASPHPLQLIEQTGEAENA